MRVRLFIKMIVLYFCIVISTLTMLGVLLSFLINNYFLYNKQTEMMVKASNISDLVKPYLIDNRYPGAVVTLLNGAEKDLGTEIWIIDPTGKTIASGSKDKEHEGDLIDSQDIEEMNKGKTSVRQGKSTIFGEKALWVVTPIEYNDKIIGGTIMFSPIIGITQTTSKVRYLFIYSAIVSTVFATIVVHFMAKYVTGPLWEIRRVSKYLAKGDFTKRVQVPQNDEIGDLALAFNHMASQIEKQEKVRRDFVADVSHELRSPLSNIQGFIEAMIDRKDKTQEDRNRYLSIIHKETLRLSRLVNELLYLSRIDSGPTEIGVSPVNLVEVIEHSIQKFKPSAEEKNQNIKIADFPDDEIYVSGNYDRLEQVITNLLDNANRYSQENSNITITLEKRAGNVEVLVKDEGEGIPAEELPLIWERFYKVDKSRSRQHGGTGLGLAIVRQIIESMGGTVKADSRIGSGTQIGFELPLYYQG